MPAIMLQPSCLKCQPVGVLHVALSGDTVGAPLTWMSKAFSGAHVQLMLKHLAIVSQVEAAGAN